MNCIIVDDDTMSRAAARHFVERSGLLNLVAECENAEEAMAVLTRENIDLVFLDVNMPGMSGLDLIKNLEHKPFFILITARKEYALEAFEQNVLDYLLKPYTYPRFLKAVERAVSKRIQIKQTSNVLDDLFVKVENGRLLKIKATDILFIEALADYVIINAIVNKTQEKFTIHSTMKSIESKLSPNDFLRVHRSFIVRLDKITELEENTLNVSHNLIPIGRSYRSDLNSRLNFI